jgi:hypothetical protein
MGLLHGREANRTVGRRWPARLALFREFATEVEGGRGRVFACRAQTPRSRGLPLSAPIGRFVRANLLRRSG